MTRSNYRRCRMSAATSLALIVAVCSAFPAEAQEFKPNDVIEYKVGGAMPERWERGIVVRPLDGGKQILIREKPSQFFPEGPQTAYARGDLRAPQAARPPLKDPPAKPAVPPDAPPVAGNLPIAVAQGLLSKDEIFRDAQQRFGPGDPFADGQRRDAILEAIRDRIKSRGTNFVSDAEFQNKLHAIGAYSVHIVSAIEANFGPTPRLDDYFGTYLLRTANRGTKSAARDGGRVIITTSDAQFESGALTINRDGTFVWKLSRTDPQQQWIQGRWREMKGEEMNAWEGGPALWLEKARQGEDYMVRMCRVPGYENWIDVGMGKGRIAVHYGRRPD